VNVNRDIFAYVFAANPAISIQIFVTSYVLMLPLVATVMIHHRVKMEIVWTTSHRIFTASDK
jgi:hypothetical protein